MFRNPVRPADGQSRWHWSLLAIGALVVSLAIFSAACDDDDDGEPTPAGETPAAETPAAETPAAGGPVDALAAIGFPESARVFLREALEQGIIDNFLFVDGTRSQEMFDDLGADNFEGLYGTAPGAADPEAGARFDAAYEAATGRSTEGQAFIRESYDAAFIIALAAVAANSTDPAAIRDHIRFVANPPGEAVSFGADEFARAVGLLADGQDIDYSGAAGPIDFDVNGDVVKGAIDIWRVVNGQIATQETREVDLQATLGTEVPAGTLAPAADTPTEALKIGALLSFTGDLSDFGEPLFDAINMAVTEINSAGGVFGQDVQLARGDDGTAPEQGQTAARTLIDVDGVHAIIGALSSGVTLPIAESVTGPEGVIQVSPASTSPALSEASDNDFLFRTTISDAAQGIILAQLADELGLGSVCTLYVNTPYGQGLSEVFAEAFAALGGTVPQQVPHEQEQTSYVSELRRCVGS